MLSTTALIVARASLNFIVPKVKQVFIILCFNDVAARLIDIDVVGCDKSRKSDKR
jgi:hypothetical protein